VVIDPLGGRHELLHEGGGLREAGEAEGAGDRVPLAHPLGEDGETAVDLVIGEYGKLGHAHLR